MSNDTPAETLVTTLETVPPGSQLTLTWDPTGTHEEPISATGRVADTDPTVGDRRIETEERTLALTPASDRSEITVTDINSGTAHTCGRLIDITVLGYPVETVRLSADGVTVPDYLIGYTGFLFVDDEYGQRQVRITDPGLRSNDPRILGYKELPATHQYDEPVIVRPIGGPHRQYEVIDDRPDNSEISIEEIVPCIEDVDTDYELLEPTIHTIQALMDAVDDDPFVNGRDGTELRRHLYELLFPLLQARRTLLDPDPTPEWQPTAELGRTDWDEYGPILDLLGENLETLYETAKHEDRDNLDRYQVPVKFNHAQKVLEKISPVLRGLDDDEIAEYPRDEIDGREQGSGYWLEYQLERAFHRWGYRAATHQRVYGVEIDVTARRREKQNRPTDWIVAECKDWESRKVTPRHLFRLIALAFTCRAMPVFCHTTALTKRAREIANRWEVRVLTLDDLGRGSLPTPNITAPSTDLLEYQANLTARERRGTLPLQFYDEPNKQFTYVPEFEPHGSNHKYRPVDGSGTTSDDGGE